MIIDLLKSFAQKLSSDPNIPLDSVTVVGSSTLDRVNPNNPEIDVLVFLRFQTAQIYRKIGKTIKSMLSEGLKFSVQLGTIDFIWHLGNTRQPLTIHLLILVTSEVQNDDPAYGLYPTILHRMAKNRRVIFGNDVLGTLSFSKYDSQDEAKVYLNYLKINYTRLADLGVRYGAEGDVSFLAENAIDLGKRILYKGVTPLFDNPIEAESLFRNKKLFKQFLYEQYPNYSNQLDLLMCAIQNPTAIMEDKQKAERLFDTIVDFHVVITNRLKDLLKDE